MKKKLGKLKAKLDRQLTIFKKQNTDTASYLTAKKTKPFRKDNFIKESLSVVREVFPGKKGGFESISVSERTVIR